MKRSFARWFVALIVISLVFGQGTWVLAGTTGVLAGTVIDGTTNQGVAGAKVTAASPSQVATARTDNTGHYVFLNLAPDTYTISVDAGSGFEPQSASGVTVVADQTRQLGFNLSKQLTTIATVKTRSASSLVKPGTTSDVYSVGAAQQAKVAAAGGGGNLNSAWSALSTVPGVAVAPGQNGYIGAGATLSIRGGDYDQIGYQIDGVPVNRAFDNYPSGPVSSLGQQELQVYTGAPPASSSSQGISGYINQVIKTGTNPGFTSTDVAVGGPSYYHKLSFELGGATADRHFSYYVGLGGYNQSFRTPDNFNGSGIGELFGTPIGPCSGSSISVTPSCYTSGAPNNENPAGSFVLGNGALFNASAATIADRDSVVNLHYYIPHKDGTRDDIQALYLNNFINNQFYSSPNDQGGYTFLTNAGFGPPLYLDGFQFNSPTGVFLPSNYQALTTPYLFPNTPNHSFFFGSGGPSPIDANERDGFNNNQAVEKLQYTKSLGTNAIARVYAYSYYSDWLQTGPNCTFFDENCGISPDYELSSHTRGVDLSFSDQINSQNLLSLEGSWTTANVLRDNNTQMLNGFGLGARSVLGVLVDSNNPTSGMCYTPTGTPVSCYSSAGGSFNSAAGFVTINQAYSGAIPAATGTCGTGPCQYFVVGNGQYATYNQVMPIFWGASLTDEWRPNSKLTVNAGVRVDIYQYQLASTAGTAARQFWYNAWNMDNCVNSSNEIFNKVSDLSLASPTDACPTGYSAANFVNPSGTTTFTYPVWQPRLGATYAISPNTVIRASYGRYAQPPNSAFEQYNALQANAPGLLYGTYGFYKYGFTSPNHEIPPAQSSNYDLSLEQALPDQFSLKLTPFLRKTQNQIQQFFLNQQTGFVSGLNVGNQTSEGVEFEVDKGDFSQQGLTAKLSFTYTNSYIKYNTLPGTNGLSVIDALNDGIAQYDSFTKSGGGAACYAAGKPDPTCSATGTVANPYYNAPSQSLMSTTANYTPYDVQPAGPGTSVNAYGYPYLATLILNERVKNFSITPIVQFFGGQRYGAPLDVQGVDPSTCSALGTYSPVGDPRYPYGAAGGSAYDAASCTGQIAAIPNPQTGRFDSIGAFVQPNQVLLNFQLSYEVSKNFSIVANLANVVNSCFGGSNVPWKITGACTYGLPAGGSPLANGSTGAIGNVYNPGQALQPYVSYPYLPTWNQNPFGAFVSANFRI